MKVLPVHAGAFTVLLRLECNARESEGFANELAEFLVARTRFHAGFLSAVVYISDDARKVLVLHQWARGEDWLDFRASHDGRKAVEWLAGRPHELLFLETVRAVTAPPPGGNGSGVEGRRA